MKSIICYVKHRFRAWPRPPPAHPAVHSYAEDSNCTARVHSYDVIGLIGVHSCGKSARRRGQLVTVAVFGLRVHCWVSWCHVGVAML